MVRRAYAFAIALAQAGCSAESEINPAPIEPPPPPVPVDIALDSGVACALLSDGRVVCWGCDDAVGMVAGEYGTVPPTLISGVTRAKAIAVGGHGCALLEDRTVACWGSNSLGALGDGYLREYYGYVAEVYGVTDAVRLWSGVGATCAQTVDGQTYCWGALLTGSGARPECNTAIPEVIPFLEEVESVVPPSCAIDSDGRVFCWGWNWDGLFGDAGALESSEEPVFIEDIPPMQQLAVDTTSCGITLDGEVWCWGFDVSELGLSLPKPVAGIADARAISIGGAAIIVQLENGTTLSWGHSVHGELSMGDFDETYVLAPSPTVGLDRAVKVDMGYGTACALYDDGRIGCWGSTSCQIQPRQGDASQPVDWRAALEVE